MTLWSVTVAGRSPSSPERSGCSFHSLLILHPWSVKFINRKIKYKFFFLINYSWVVHVLLLLCFLRLFLHHFFLLFILVFGTQTYTFLTSLKALVGLMSHSDAGCECGEMNVPRDHITIVLTSSSNSVGGSPSVDVVPVVIYTCRWCYVTMALLYTSPPLILAHTHIYIYIYSFPRNSFPFCLVHSGNFF